MMSYVVVLVAMPTPQRTFASITFLRIQEYKSRPPSIPEAVKEIHTPLGVDAWVYIASVPSLLLQ